MLSLITRPAGNVQAISSGLLPFCRYSRSFQCLAITVPKNTIECRCGENALAPGCPKGKQPRWFKSCENPSDPGSDNLNLAIVLAIEGRNQNVNTVVECVDQASEELLRKAGCDRIVCTSRFDAHFLSQELMNPGVQEVIDDLLSAREGQQIYISSIREATTFDEVAGRCREEGHLAIGICTPDGPRMNVGGETPLTNRDRVITIGPHRLESL